MPRSKMPRAKNGFIKTLNKTGFMTTRLDPFSREFVQFAKKAPGPSLEIGAAYGIATIPVLKKGCPVVANDLSARHLKILKSRVPKKLLKNLTLLPGRFPGKINLTKNSVGSILACRIMHFLDGPTIRRGLKKMHAWLKPGGKIFIIAGTAYVGTLKGFIPIYEKKLKAGSTWPGYVRDFHKQAPDLKNQAPGFLHALDVHVLSRELKRAGFTVEKAAIFSRPYYPKRIRLDGRESVGIIGKKIP